MTYPQEIQEFIDDFAKLGITFTEEELETVFYWHIQKTHNLIKETDNVEQTTQSNNK